MLFWLFHILEIWLLSDACVVDAAPGITDFMLSVDASGLNICMIFPMATCCRWVIVFALVLIFFWWTILSYLRGGILVLDVRWLFWFRFHDKPAFPVRLPYASTGGVAVPFFPLAPRTNLGSVNGFTFPSLSRKTFWIDRPWGIGRGSMT